MGSNRRVPPSGNVLYTPKQERAQSLYLSQHNSTGTQSCMLFQFCLRRPRNGTLLANIQLLNLRCHDAAAYHDIRGKLHRASYDGASHH